MRRRADGVLDCFRKKDRKKERTYMMVGAFFFFGKAWYNSRNKSMMTNQIVIEADGSDMRCFKIKR